MCHEVAHQKGWCCYIFWFLHLVILEYFQNQGDYSNKFGIILKLNSYANNTENFMAVGFIEHELRIFKEKALGVVPEAVPPEAVPPVQSQWGFSIFCAIWGKTLISLSKLHLQLQIWYQIKASTFFFTI